MTRPNLSPLVLDGSEIKLRLHAERKASGSYVHVDWVRFTCLLRNAPFPKAENLFPTSTSVWDEASRQAEFQRLMADLPDPDFSASVQARELADEVAQKLGPDFIVKNQVLKGHDFYRFRWSIERHGCEVGWVGFLTSGDSPRQSAQSQTIHCNLYGAACTFADFGWNHRIADLVDSYDAKLTRADLALDFFDGLPGNRNMDHLVSDYKNGAMDNAGKRPKVNMVGDWINGHSRSFYLGSKGAGKETNVYEKGDQLFGPDEASKWVRIELRYGNKLRYLPSDMLRRPSDFFAGASEWHALTLAEADKFVVPESVPQESKLAPQTVLAEVTRNVRWAMSTAAPTVAAAVEFLGLDALVSMFGTHNKLPGRLQRFSKTELLRAFTSVSIAGGDGPSLVPAS